MSCQLLTKRRYHQDVMAADNELEVCDHLPAVYVSKCVKRGVKFGMLMRTNI